VNSQRAAGFGFLTFQNLRTASSSSLKKFKISDGSFKALKEVGVFMNEMVENQWFFHYNKKCLCMSSDFNGFQVNSLVIVNRDQ